MAGLDRGWAQKGAAAARAALPSRKVHLAPHLRQAHVVSLSGGNSSAVERQPSKLGVAGSNPVSRSIVTGTAWPAWTEGGLSEMRGAAMADAARDIDNRLAHVAQLAEHALGKGEVSGSIPDMGSRFFSPTNSVDGR